MKPAPFTLRRPRELAEVVALLADDPWETKLLAGGQSLVPLLNFRLVQPLQVVDLGEVSELRWVREGDGEMQIGAMVTQRELQRATGAHPLLHLALAHVGHVPTRNRGTVGGSLAHADAAAELPLCWVTLGGTLTARSPRGDRTIPAEDFFVTHLTSALEPDEVLISATAPTRRANEGCGFAELSPRHGDYAVAMAAAVLRLSEGEIVAARIAVGAAGDRPLAIPEAAASLVGTTLGREAVAACAEASMAAANPLESVHAGSEYRREMVGVMVRRAVAAAYADARERAAA